MPSAATRTDDERTGQDLEADQGRHRRLGSRHRHGGPCPGDLAGQAVLRRRDRLRRRAQCAGLPGRRRDAGHAAGHQRGMRRARRCAPGSASRRRINLRSVFDRKNYFYPDLPQGYQISQYKYPIVGEGEVVVDMPDGETITVGIERLHLEQDAGKILHDQHPDHVLRRPQPLRRRADGDRLEARYALRRARPRPSSPSCAPSCAISAPATATWRREVCAPTSTSRCAGRASRSAPAARSRTSTPSASSARRSNTRRAARSRSSRTAARSSRRRGCSTPDKGETRSMRSKEEAHDYRYFPDPDLLPLELTQDYVDALARALPELPDEKKARFMRDFGLSGYDAGVLVAERESAGFFEAVSSGPTARRDAKLAANWVINELFGRLNKEGRDISASPVSAAQLGTILDLIGRGNDLRQDRQGCVRHRLERRRRSPRRRRGARHEAGDRLSARSRRSSTRSSPKIPTRSEQGASQADDDRLVRRSGDEGVGRQGESAGGERSSQGEARFVIGAIAPARRAEGDTRRHRRRPRRTGIGTTKTAAGPSQALARSIRASVFAIGRDRFARFSLPRTCRIRFKSAFRKDVRRIFFAAKIARGGAARRLRRVVANAVKPCLLRCARVFRHGCNAQFAMAFTIQRI